MDEVYLDARRVGDVEPPKRQKGLKAKIKAFFQNPRKRLIFIIISGLILILAAAAGYYFYMKNTDKVAIENVEKDAAPTLYQAPLDGVMITDVAASTRHPLGVIIENHTDARPQQGLTAASIVYEAIAEGGITRFLALYGTNTPDEVGPIRSMRTYFLNWAEGYEAYTAHVGGNIDALDQIRSDGALDLDQFRYSAPYGRKSGLGVSSEHTMFASVPKLYDQASANKYTTDNNFKVYAFKDDAAKDSAEYAALPESQSISINYGNPNYNVVFNYDKATNSYLRSMGGKPHSDRISKAQINPKNVIVMTVNRKATVTRINEHGYIMTTTGEGTARMFIDGKEIIGTWKKTSNSSREVFYDAAGKEITFNRGQFWISVISPDLPGITVQ